MIYHVKIYVMQQTLYHMYFDIEMFCSRKNGV